MSTLHPLRTLAGRATFLDMIGEDERLSTGRMVLGMLRLAMAGAAGGLVARRVAHLRR